MREKNRLFSKVWDMPYGRTSQFHLFDAAKNSRRFVQKLQLQTKIPVHNGCVNSICWNETGKYLLSGSDDQRLSIVHGYDYSVLAYIQTGHRANIFSAKFLPNTGDSHVISCSGDGIIIYSDLERPETSMNNKFNCHVGTAYEIMTVPNDPNTFLSCGEDRTVRWFDLRTKNSCANDDCKEDVLINCRSPVTSLAVNPLTPYQLAVGCADASVRLFDRRMLGTRATGNYSSNGFQALMTCFTVPEFTQSRRITSLCYSADGEEMLVSYSSDYIYLFDVRDDLEKKPRLLSRDSPTDASDNETGLYFRGRPLMKRLRVRGDWSDTGPNARPEAESRGEQQETSSQATLMRRMTDVLTRMFNSSTRNRTRSTASQSSSASSHVSSQSEDSEMEASDSNEDDREGVTEEEKKSKSDASKLEKAKNDAGPSTSKVIKQNHEKKVEKVNDSKKTSSSSAFEHEKPSTSSKSSFVPVTIIEPSTSPPHVASKSSDEPKEHCESVSSSAEEVLKTSSEAMNLSLQNLEQELSHRRNDLIEKHHVEPMVNLHYSGQSVSSGLITMGVASASTANERQWLEQSQDLGRESVPSPDADDVTELNDHESAEVRLLQDSQPAEETANNNETITLNPESTAPLINPECETDAAVQTIQPTYSHPMVTASISNTLNTDSTTAETGQDASGELVEGEVALMMEVDSWDMESDEDVRPPSPQPSGTTRRSSCDRLPDSFFRSLDDEVKVRNEELKKEEAHMANVTQPRVKRKFTGHRNARTMIKEATFWGNNFIMSGSDCGHIFIWDRQTAELIMLMEADHHVVNCLQPHPFDPILASSGIDYDIKLWAPLRDEPFFDLEKASEMIKRNEVMLEETKDTITVPASFMIRMLATLNHFRSGHGYSWSRAAREMRSANSDSSTR